MGYSLPLNFVKVSNNRSDNRQFDVGVCITRIVAIMSTDIYQARKTIAQEKKNGTLINAAGIAKAKSAIFLDNGSVIASPLSVNRLMHSIAKANSDVEASRVTKKMKVYDMSHFDDENEIAVALDLEDEELDDDLENDLIEDDEEEDSDDEDSDDDDD